MAYAVPPPYGRAIRGPVAITYTADATYNGTVTASGLQPTGGTITDTIKPGARRTLNLEVAGDHDLYDALKPYGTTVTVTAHVQYPSRQSADIPMGVFDVDSQSLSEGDGKVTLTAPDKWARIARARFLWPTGPQVGLTVTEQITRLIRDALGPDEPVNVLATSKALVPALTWQQDRGQAVIDLATSIGAWVYFDRSGMATIADVPTVGGSADWLLDASASGVMVSLDRSRSRAQTYNVVVVSSTAADGAKFATQYVWDSDPSSPTYAGTNPPFATAVGPFGIVPYFHDDPILLDADDALVAGAAILAKTVGLASQASLSAAGNPAVDAMDVIDVMPPRLQRTEVRFTERHVVDTVTHQLDVRQPQQITGRSTRTDPYT